MSQQILGFIGAGNMARALVGGLVADGFPAENIWVSDVNSSLLEAMKQDFSVHTTAHNTIVAEHADLLVLAVKPQVLREVAEALAATVQSFKPLIISIAAGIESEAIERWLGGDLAIVRAMPNTPAMVGTGATGLYANSRATFAQKGAAESVLRAVGLTVWVEAESLIDAVTALSGSGPAYFFLFMEAMEDAGIQLGLEPKTARLLAQQTALGAGKIAIESSEAPAELRRKVTSPGGTTERAIQSFEQGELRSLVHRAMQAAADRSAELSRQLGAL
jgi:pyrroline-5-carboxylate reductase